MGRRESNQTNLAINCHCNYFNFLKKKKKKIRHLKIVKNIFMEFLTGLGALVLKELSNNKFCFNP